MKNYKVALIVAGIFLILGVSFLWAGFQGRVAETVTIPAGEEWYYYLEYDMASSGVITVHFTETQGYPLDVYVFNSASYSSYSFYGYANSITEVRGQSSGTISTSLSSAGKYYVVFDHGSGYDNVEQQVHISGRDIGLGLFPIILAIVFLIIGIVFAVFGITLKRSHVAKEEHMEPPDDDVVFFDSKR